MCAQAIDLLGVLPRVLCRRREIGGGASRILPRGILLALSITTVLYLLVSLAAVRSADRCRYPDPAYTALRQTLGRFHGVPAERVVIGGSASELILRISLCASRRGVRQAWWPAAAYGDYAHAAGVAGLQRTDTLAAAGLAWLCEPASPTGRNEPALAQLDAGHAWRVLDAAYEPLRLSGAPSLAAAQCSRLWQLCTPNKALGLTGVRAAYALAPVGAADEVQALEAAAPSWVLGAEGVALLTAWTTPAVQRWLADSLPTLREWKRLQLDWLQARGWQHLPGDTPFLCVQPPGPLDLPALRRHELDCVIGRLHGQALGREFQSEVLYEEPVVAVVRNGHPLLRK